MAFHNSVSFLSFFVVLAILPIINAQIVASPCTAPMLTSFTPCMNFLGNGNGTAAPSAGCCNALKTMMGNGSACLCAIATGGVPFQIPINPNTTMSLPRACNMARVPLQCKASSSPAPAPGPVGTEAPSASPTSSPSPSPSPRGSTTDLKPMSPASAPQANVVPTETPPSPTAASSGHRQNPATPSAAPSVSYGFSPLALIAASGASAYMLY